MSNRLRATVSEALGDKGGSFLPVWYISSFPSPNYLGHIPVISFVRVSGSANQLVMNKCRMNRKPLVKPDLVPYCLLKCADSPIVLFY